LRTQGHEFEQPFWRSALFSNFAAPDIGELPGGAGRGGVLTPATALGDRLVRRLRAADTPIEVSD
jgi:short subunit dehydrogenase-like uncharacterized protein